TVSKKGIGCRTNSISVKRGRPFRIQAFHSLFKPPATAPHPRELRCHHQLGLSPIKINLTVAFVASQFADFANVESFHLSLSLPCRHERPYGHITPNSSASLRKSLA